MLLAFPFFIDVDEDRRQTGLPQKDAVFLREEEEPRDKRAFRKKSVKNARATTTSEPAHQLHEESPTRFRVGNSS